MLDYVRREAKANRLKTLTSQQASIEEQADTETIFF
jgi:hypothetical protein